MKTINASEFKAKCLNIIEEVHNTGAEVIITKRGKVVARLVPDYRERGSSLSDLKNTVTWNTDPFEPVLPDKELVFPLLRRK